MKRNYQKGLYNDYAKVVEENEELKIKNALLKEENKLIAILQQRNAILKEEQAKYQNERETAKSEKEALEKENARLRGLLNLDGTNSHLPTSKTPINKKKIIPNSRVKSGKKKGGQKGHPQAQLKSFSEDDVTEIQEHVPHTCDHCGSTEFEKTGKSIHKDELDYKLVVIKRRHFFFQCKCKNCSKRSYEPIPFSLKDENQYGEGVTSLALSLTNTANVSVNKTQKMISGLSEQEITPSEGWIIKQQKKASNNLETFMIDLKKRCVEQNTIYWDETVVDINTKRSCLRFYGNEKLALYTAHEQKNKAGLDEDGILSLLGKETNVIHDHNKVNYNKEYSFSNVECNAHLLRDIEKVSQYLKRNWSSELKELISGANAKRNELLEKGEESFTEEYVADFFNSFNFILAQGLEDNRLEKPTAYWLKEESNLLKRLIDYKDNYFGWVTNFELPFTNNLSERALRGIKSKMKVSGQFQSVEFARHYANIKSYIETCYRNGINTHTALVRLCQGNPYTLDEIFSDNL